MSCHSHHLGHYPTHYMRGHQSQGWCACFLHWVTQALVMPLAPDVLGGFMDLHQIPYQWPGYNDILMTCSFVMHVTILLSALCLWFIPVFLTSDRHQKRTLEDKLGSSDFHPFNHIPCLWMLLGFNYIWDWIGLLITFAMLILHPCFLLIISQRAIFHSFLPNLLNNMWLNFWSTILVKVRFDTTQRRVYRLHTFISAFPMFLSNRLIHRWQAVLHLRISHNSSTLL